MAAKSTIETWLLWKHVMAIPYVRQATQNPRFAECLLLHCNLVTQRVSGLDERKLLDRWWTLSSS
jgi:hypothetical protein